MDPDALNKESLIEILGILMQQVRDASEYLRLGEIEEAKGILADALKHTEDLNSPPTIGGVEGI